jgi:hypothetical protein
MSGDAHPDMIDGRDRAAAGTSLAIRALDRDWTPSV